MVDETKAPPAPKAKAEKAEGPDNNKRLAALEAGVTDLLGSLVVAGIELKADQDPIEQAIAIVDRWREQALIQGEIGALILSRFPNSINADEGALATALRILTTTPTGEDVAKLAEPIEAIRSYLTDKYPAIVEAGGTLPEMVIEAIETVPVPSTSEQSEADGLRIASLEGQVDRLADVIIARPHLAAQIAEGETAVDTAIKILETTGHGEDPVPEKGRAKAKSVRSRKCGPIDVDRTVLADAILDGNRALEVVLSDGRNEITDFAPYEVRPSNFSKGAHGYKLNVPLFARGATQKRRLGGFGLFLDGKQIGWCAHPPLDLLPGTEPKFEHAVFF